MPKNGRKAAALSAAPQRAPSQLTNLALMAASVAAVTAGDVKKPGKPADPASLYAVDMVRPSHTSSLAIK